MFLIFGILTIITGILFLVWFMQIKDREQTFIDYANDYPIYHWKFLIIRYKVSYIKWTSFILTLLGISMIIVFFMQS